MVDSSSDAQDDTRDDEHRWAEAQSILDRAPTPSAEQRLRRWRRGRWAFVAASMAMVAAVAVLVTVLVLGSSSPAAEPSMQQQVIGWSISGAGLVLEVVGLGLLVRGGAFRAWRQPIAVLTRPQRGSLLAQVRGRVPADPARVPLARHLAQQLIDQRRRYVWISGLAVLQVGQAISMPETWRVVLSAAFVTLVAVGAALTSREVRRARRFLDRHPGPAADPVD